MKLPILLDVDTGVDDALALLLALRSPELEVRAITTVAGNTTVENVLRNTLLVLEVAQAPEIPVARGAERPLVRAPVTAPEVHGEDGLGHASRVYPPPARAPAAQDAASLILSQVAAGGLTLVATGPLTNLALAWQADPHTFAKLRRLVIMGGAFRHQGNTGPVAEFNFFCDPEAAQAVLNSGVPITLVPLDVTEHVVFSRRLMKELSQERDSSVFQFVREFTCFWMDFHRQTLGVDGGQLHDPLTVAAAAFPRLLRTVETRVDVETCGAFTAGMSVGDWRGRPAPAQFVARTGALGPPNVELAVEADGAGFLELFYERVCR